MAGAEVGDSGDLPATAQEPGPQGPLAQIDGTLTGSSDRDMFKVCLTGGSADFSATTIGGAGFDTQLFLFDSNGRGVYANDDFGAPQSGLPPDHRLTPTERGVYYLAISTFDWDPVSLLGRIFNNRSGVVGPTLVAGMLPISGWTPDNQQLGGAYSIFLTGTRSCVDSTPPTITVDVPAEGASYARGSTVAARYECADDLEGSGLVSCIGTADSGEPIDTATLGSKSFTVTAEDASGNVTTVTRTYTVVDRSSPTIVLQQPWEGQAYARGSTVAAEYACHDEDGGSGVLTCVGTVPNGDPIDTSTSGTHAFTVTATDAAGNTASVTHTYRVTDQMAPTIQLQTPADGAAYARGSTVRANYGCRDEDGGSGVVSCTGTVSNGAAIDTAAPGEHEFTVRAEDAAGNVSSQTVTYTVTERTGFDFEGFLRPVVNRPRFNLVKAGRVVPMRFRLGGFKGLDVIAKGYPQSRAIACRPKGDYDEGEPTRHAGRRPLLYRQRRDVYLYPWKTDSDWAGSCRQFILKLADGSYQRADFRFFGRRHHGHPGDRD